MGNIESQYENGGHCQVIIGQISAIICTVATNAPFGIGTLASTITQITNQLNTYQGNNVNIAKFLKSIETISNILNNIGLIPPNVQQAIEIANTNISDNINELFDYITKINNSNGLAKFVMAKHHNAELRRLYKNLKESQNTLSFALIVQNQVQIPYHKIPGSVPVTWAYCRPLAQTSDQNDNRCMIEQKKANIRCPRIDPKFMLISKNGNAMYLCCGNCAKDSKNAWWVKHYNRTLRPVVSDEKPKPKPSVGIISVFPPIR